MENNEDYGAEILLNKSGRRKNSSFKVSVDNKDQIKATNNNNLNDSPDKNKSGFTVVIDPPEDDFIFETENEIPKNNKNTNINTNKINTNTQNANHQNKNQTNSNNNGREDDNFNSLEEEMNEMNE